MSSGSLSYLPAANSVVRQFIQFGLFLVVTTWGQIFLIIREQISFSGFELLDLCHAFFLGANNCKEIRNQVSLAEEEKILQQQGWVKILLSC